MLNYILAFVILLSVAGCGGGTADDPLPGDYIAAKASWQASHISDYRFTLDQACLCPSRGGARVVMVRDGQVVSAVYSDGTPVDAADLARIPSMSDIYATVDAAYARGLQVRFVAGSPHGEFREVYIDYIKGAADDELRYTISGFAIEG
ncbi:DUF6174 domain-containing protein [Caenimonas aquaedulcis]|uniref:Uncharacterized protein n=1 Tax=Caenimonas aquaedulcis TaxID=2793270 RepID=A0A931H1R4_9BURK|nr:DUF6174 domain-containing protein [Caenimonas aquaedulcis]MBG9386946.1 hypothetical protein [Caenimonas aquaedulcis]